MYSLFNDFSFYYLYNILIFFYYISRLYHLSKSSWIYWPLNYDHVSLWSPNFLFGNFWYLIPSFIFEGFRISNIDNHLPFCRLTLWKAVGKLALGLRDFTSQGTQNGPKVRLQMMCLGLNWDPQTRKDADWQPLDGSRPPYSSGKFSIGFKINPWRTWPDQEGNQRS